MTGKTSLWLRGLGAACIMGAAGVLEIGGAQVLIEPEQISEPGGLRKMVMVTALAAAIGAVRSTAAYLRRSPIPDHEIVTQPVAPPSGDAPP